VRADLSFTGEELIADPASPPAEDTDPARWTRKGWYVFRRGEWFLLVRGYHLDLGFWGGGRDMRRYRIGFLAGILVGLVTALALAIALGILAWIILSG
jgi:hypothetical protein